MKIEKLPSYEKRLRRVSDYIYENLDQEIDLMRLADVACMSPYHWHRIYKAVYGETIAATVRRIRLAQAASDLTNTKDGVANISQRAGFQNLQSFNRLFKLSYGMPPAEYRKRGAHVQFDQPYNEEVKDMYDVKIINQPAKKMACIPHKGSYMKIGMAFERVFGTLGGRPMDWSKHEMVALYYDDPDTIPEDDLSSKAGFTCPEDFEISAPLESETLHAGEYAVLHYKGPYSDMRKAYDWLFGQWLINSGRETADHPCFEIYLNNPRDTPANDLLTNICLPLK
jgi:AraC family transcriptional regulator